MWNERGGHYLLYKTVEENAEILNGSVTPSLKQLLNRRASLRLFNSRPVSTAPGAGNLIMNTMHYVLAVYLLLLDPVYTHEL